MKAPRLLWALPFLFAYACGPLREEGGVPSDSTFIQVMARLSLIRQEFAARAITRPDSLREAVLAEFRVTPDQLKRYALRHGDDPGHMRTVWDSIAVVAKSLNLRFGATAPSAFGNDSLWSPSLRRQAQQREAARRSRREASGRDTAPSGNGG
ncbi:MAG: hypothetical protein ACE5HQ_05560 [Gemmatimonadota bacterium]